MSKPKRFTLIELIAVVVIILILLSLLGNTILQARRKTKAVLCVAQQRDVYLSLTLYCRGNRGIMPEPYNGSAWSQPESTWSGRLLNAGYGQRQQFFCPATRSATNTVDMYDNGLRASYGLAGGGSIYVGLKPDALVNPANTILLTDSTYGDDWYLRANSNFYLFDYCHGAYMIHSARAAVSFNDGAVILADQSRLEATESWLPIYYPLPGN